MRTPPGWLWNPLVALAVLAYLAVGGYLMFSIERADGLGSGIVVLIAFVVLAAIAGFVLVRYWAWLVQGFGGRRRRLLSAFAFGVGVMMIATDYNWIGINAIGGGEPQPYSGPVLRKRIDYGRRHISRYLVTVKQSGGAEPVSLKVDRALYESVAVGDVVDCEYRIGRFGVVYRWIYDIKPSCLIRLQPAAAPVASMGS